MNGPEQVADEMVGQVVDLFKQLTACVGHLDTQEWLGIDLTIQQIKVMFLLWDRGSASVGGLAAAVGVTQPTMTGILDRLVEHGLVRRQESPEDRRLVVNYLTEPASELAARLQETNRSRLVSILNRMSPSDLSMLIESLTRLTEAACQDRRS